ncbi:hypothetical protein HQO44_19960 [Rhodococcus fascians]|uniref:hypothetical protein n=1 Tax=Rhodococcus sp. 06-1474-1B TaxID=2022499 RepID=UPI000B9B1B69|nr:hypothetical protein [Rhodococcus sp. 06-1474-1B]MBY4208731.1 hypothetical protein [Rhodococcus fascians]OZD46926.1 hypothetical protein CH266_19000 [Rhodococcus sp. 06-1474-1B]OZD52432.1 hypothetical protein CH252_13485 [Rhodococcus sp. 06-1477-1B]
MIEQGWAAAALESRSVSAAIAGGALADEAAAAAIESARRLESALAVDTPIPLQLTIEKSCDDC